MVSHYHVWKPRVRNDINVVQSYLRLAKRHRTRQMATRVARRYDMDWGTHQDKAIVMACENPNCMDRPVGRPRKE